MLKSLLLQMVVISPIIYWTNDIYSFFLLSITLDSIFSAFGFIYLYLKTPDDEKTIMKNHKSLYKVDIIDRYIYYLLLQIFYTTFRLLFWWESYPAVYYTLIFFICPKMINHLSLTLFNRIFNYIEDEKYKFYKTVICKQLANIINIISIHCLEYESEIKHEDLYNVFNMNISENIKTFLKSILIISLVNYGKDSYPGFYSTMIDYVYKYNTGKKLKNIDLETAKENVKKVLEAKDWPKLLQNNILQSVISIYCLQKNNNNILDEYLTFLSYTSSKMIVIWTLSSFFNDKIIISSVSLFLLFYKIYHSELYKGESFKYHILLRLIIYLPETINFILPYFFKLLYDLFNIKLKFELNIVISYFVLSFITEFGYNCIFNKLSYAIVNYLYGRIKYYTNILVHYNEYNCLLISLLVYIELMKILNILYPNSLEYDYVFINFIFIISNIDNSTKKFIILNIIFFGLFSFYERYHIIYLALINYIIMNIYDYKKEGLRNKDIIKEIIESCNMIKDCNSDSGSSSNIFIRQENMFVENVEVESESDSGSIFNSMSMSMSKLDLELDSESESEFESRSETDENPQTQYQSLTLSNYDSTLLSNSSINVNLKQIKSQHGSQSFMIFDDYDSEIHQFNPDDMFNTISDNEND